MSGAIKANGSFEMETLVSPGDYAVVLSENVPAATPLISPKYASAVTSGLRVTISATGEKHFHFDVTQ